MILCPTALAHRPIFSEKAATDPNTAVVIPRPEVSQVMYRGITAQAKQVWLAFDVNEGFELFIQTDWAQFPEWKKRIRKFHELSEEGGGPRIPVLSDIGDLFKAVAAAAPPAEKPDPNTTVESRDGVAIYTAETEYQNHKQQIRVLLPDSYRKDKHYRVLYVLPVEKGFDQRYGYGLGVLKRMDAHNKHDIIIVQMGFEKEPWYGDHASDPNTRQAAYLKEFVVPFVEKLYSTVGTPEGRLLFGFSKSGWGAFSLILKYPEFFGYAASWDAPMFFDRFHYKMKPIYGTIEQLNNFRPDLLVSRQKRHFQRRPRLVLTGEQGWGKSIPTPAGGSHTAEMHKLLEKEGLKHIYDNSLKVPHRWNERWMAPTLKTLMGLAEDAKTSNNIAD